MAVIAAARVAQCSGFADRAWHCASPAEVVLLLAWLVVIFRLEFRRAWLHVFVASFEAGLQVVENCVTRSPDVLHPFLYVIVFHICLSRFAASLRRG